MKTCRDSLDGELLERYGRTGTKRRSRNCSAGTWTSSMPAPGGRSDPNTPPTSPRRCSWFSRERRGRCGPTPPSRRGSSERPASWPPASGAAKPVATAANWPPVPCSIPRPPPPVPLLATLAQDVDRHLDDALACLPEGDRRFVLARFYERSGLRHRRSALRSQRRSRPEAGRPGSNRSADSSRGGAFRSPRDPGRTAGRRHDRGGARRPFGRDRSRRFPPTRPARRARLRPRGGTHGRGVVRLVLAGRTARAALAASVVVLSGPFRLGRPRPLPSRWSPPPPAPGRQPNPSPRRPPSPRVPRKPLPSARLAGSGSISGTRKPTGSWPMSGWCCRSGTIVASCAPKPGGAVPTARAPCPCANRNRPSASGSPPPAMSRSSWTSTATNSIAPTSSTAAGSCPERHSGAGSSTPRAGRSPEPRFGSRSPDSTSASARTSDSIPTSPASSRMPKGSSPRTNTPSAWSGSPMEISLRHPDFALDQLLGRRRAGLGPITTSCSAPGFPFADASTTPTARRSRRRGFGETPTRDGRRNRPPPTARAGSSFCIFRRVRSSSRQPGVRAPRRGTSKPAPNCARPRCACSPRKRPRRPPKRDHLSWSNLKAPRARRRRRSR